MSFVDGNMAQRRQVSCHACPKKFREVCSFIISDGVAGNSRLYLKNEVLLHNRGISSLCVGRGWCEGVV